jgi:cyclophilin family peptidyl-prolyl cis-trans isomerase
MNTEQSHGGIASMKRSSIVTLSLLAAFAAVLVAGPAVRAEDATPKPEKPAKAAKAAKSAKGAHDAAASDKAIAAIDAQIAAAKVDKSAAGWKQHLPQPRVVTFDPAKKYYAHMTTNVGTMTIEFKPKVAPMHVTNFIYLARLGFYDGLKFHRVMKGFMAQGGDPAGNGSGGPGYQFSGEFSPSAKHDQVGVVSTANAGPDTDGSQFFIMFKAYPTLDMKYSIFGQVVEGLETVKKLEDAGNPGDGPPTQPLHITSVTIEAK